MGFVTVVVQHAWAMQPTSTKAAAEASSSLPAAAATAGGRPRRLPATATATTSRRLLSTAPSVGGPRRILDVDAEHEDDDHDSNDGASSAAPLPSSSRRRRNSNAAAFNATASALDPTAVAAFVRTLSAALQHASDATDKAAALDPHAAAAVVALWPGTRGRRMPSDDDHDVFISAAAADAQVATRHALRLARAADALAARAAAVAEADADAGPDAGAATTVPAAAQSRRAAAVARRAAVALARLRTPSAASAVPPPWLSLQPPQPLSLAAAVGRWAAALRASCLAAVARGLAKAPLPPPAAPEHDEDVAGLLLLAAELADAADVDGDDALQQPPPYPAPDDEALVTSLWLCLQRLSVASDARAFHLPREVAGAFGRLHARVLPALLRSAEATAEADNDAMGGSVGADPALRFRCAAYLVPRLDEAANIVARLMAPSESSEPALSRNVALSLLAQALANSAPTNAHVALREPFGAILRDMKDRKLWQDGRVFLRLLAAAAARSPHPSLTLLFLAILSDLGLLPAPAHRSGPFPAAAITVADPGLSEPTPKPPLTQSPPAVREWLGHALLAVAAAASPAHPPRPALLHALLAVAVAPADGGTASWTTRAYALAAIAALPSPMPAAVALQVASLAASDPHPAVRAAASAAAAVASSGAASSASPSLSVSSMQKP
ncbi:hypothetical protein HK405_002425, partial [Cladochytrium tenue]